MLHFMMSLQHEISSPGELKIVLVRGDIDEKDDENVL